jgi:hypothetical protein
MLKINPAPTFSFDAQLTVPGAAELATINITAKYRKRSEVDVWIRDRQRFESDAAWLAELFVNWSNVEDDQGEAVRYSPQALADLLDTYQPAGLELFTSYCNALTESRRKN